MMDLVLRRMGLAAVFGGLAFGATKLTDGKISNLFVVHADEHMTIPGLEELSAEERAKHVKQYMRCEEMKQHALASRKVRFMFNALAELGNVITDPDKYVQCMHCDALVGAFALTHPKTTSLVGICQNHLHEQHVVTDTLTHELVHIYDNVRAHMDSGNCVHVACTEVRAAALSGECARDKEQTRGILAPGFSEPGHFAKCVRRRANNSVRALPQCADPAVCKQAMDLAFDRCFRDRAPFYTIPE